MFVRVTAPGVVELVEPEDCRRFHVESTVASPPEVAAALGDWADGASDEHVWIRVDAVRRAAEGAVGPGWAKDFDAMLVFAGTKGWLNGDGDAIAAHVQAPG